MSGHLLPGKNISSNFSSARYIVSILETVDQLYLSALLSRSISNSRGDLNGGKIRWNVWRFVSRLEKYFCKPDSGEEGETEDKGKAGDRLSVTEA